MFQIIFAILGLVYEPSYWLTYPPLNEVCSITASPRSVFIAVPNGVYILERNSLKHNRTVTMLDGIKGKIKLCAYNPAANELLIATDEQLYNFFPITGQLVPLNPPFKQISSIGITQQGAFFETESGLFHKIRTADLYKTASAVPKPVTWYGAKDTSSAQDYTFLTPYFVVDANLNPCPFLKTWLSPYDHRLFVFAQNYGILIYNLTTGLKEMEVEIGPSSAGINLIFPWQNRLGFWAQKSLFTLDSAGRWSYFPYQKRQLTASNSHPLIVRLHLLNGLDSITAFLDLNKDTTLIGTNQGIYRLNAELKNTEFVPTYSPVNAITRLRDSILVATNNGLFILINDTLKQVADPFARSDWGVFAITQTGKKIHFGTLGGILELDSNNTWTHLIPPGFDLSQPVRALTSGGRFLFVGSNNGLEVYDTEQKLWSKIDLPYSRINAIYADNHYLWLAAPEMVARYNYRAQLR
ncbi:MAG: hypothetical protein ACUVUD_01150 [bacterium]